MAVRIVATDPENRIAWKKFLQEAAGIIADAGGEGPEFSTITGSELTLDMPDKAMADGRTAESVKKLADELEQIYRACGGRGLAVRKG